METRKRILTVAKQHLPNTDALLVDDIAALAGVSVQTIYTHFGSKGGLFLALAVDVSREAGAYESFKQAWRSHDGETALRTMVEGGFDFCVRAWEHISFALRVRRTDPELGARFDAGDASRLRHLMVICRRLHEEGRLADGLTAERAAKLAFGLTTPYVYEAVVVEHKMPVRAARALLTDTVLHAVIKPGTKPVAAKEIDWIRLGLRHLPPD